MKNYVPLLLAPLTSLLVAASAHAGSTSASSDRARLEMALSCHGGAQPHELIGWISSLGGGAIVESPRIPSGAEYTMPNPVYVLGFPATRVNIRAFHGQDRDFTVYETVFPDKSFRSITSIAGLTPDQAGNYQQRVGKNHLYLREQAGVTYVTCTMGVHGPGLKRALRDPEGDMVQHDAAISSAATGHQDAPQQ